MGRSSAFAVAFSAAAVVSVFALGACGSSSSANPNASDGAAFPVNTSVNDGGNGDEAGESRDATMQGGETDGAVPLTDAVAGDDAEDPNREDAARDSGAVVPQGTAILRVHYPALSSGHTLSIRGSGPGLSWTTGRATTSSGSTFVLTITGVTSTVEFKPLLDDAKFSIGSNYHATSGQAVDIWPHFSTRTGTVETLISAFHSTVLNDTRAIYAYLPASYSENTVATYPVVYMHDGQNLWAALPQLAFNGTWNVDTAFDNASQIGACSSGAAVGWGAQPLGDAGAPSTCTGDGDCTSGDCETFPEAIVIGIANDSSRVYEYTPTTDPTESTLGPQGGADLYLEMLVTELKPQIDAMLRTRTDVTSTAMAGSSLGGLVTAYAGRK